MILNRRVEREAPIEMDLTAYKLFVIERTEGILIPLVMRYTYNLLGTNHYQDPRYRNQPIVLPDGDDVVISGHGFHCYNDFDYAAVQLWNESAASFTNYLIAEEALKPEDVVLAKISIWGPTIFCEHGYITENMEFLELFSPAPDHGDMAEMLGWPGEVKYFDLDELLKTKAMQTTLGQWALKGRK